MQSYTINSAKVVFLKQRPNTRPFKGSGNICLTCDRLLQEPFHFCSLSCKVKSKQAPIAKMPLAGAFWETSWIGAVWEQKY